MTHADDLAHQAPDLKSTFDDAIQAARPKLLDSIHIPDQHAHLLASYLRNMVFERRGIYIDGRKCLQSLGIQLQAEHEFPRDRGYPTTNEDIVERMDNYVAKAFAMRMLEQIIGFNQSILTIEGHLEQVRIQREQREIVEAAEQEASDQAEQENEQENEQEKASQKKGEAERKRPWEL